MMIYKNWKTPKTYKSVICLFDKDLLQFDPATEFTISAQLSNTKNVSEADVSQKLIERLISATFSWKTFILQFHENRFIAKRYQTLQGTHIVGHQDTGNPPYYPLVFNAETHSRNISNYSKIKLSAFRNIWIYKKFYDLAAIPS